MLARLLNLVVDPTAKFSFLCYMFFFYSFENQQLLLSRQGKCNSISRKDSVALYVGIIMIHSIHGNFIN